MNVFTKSLMLLAAVLLMFGCAAKQTNLPSFEPTRFDTALYNSKVDNFLIVFDASSSMFDRYQADRKFDIARSVVIRMNQTIPELGQTAGLRSVGHAPSVSSQPTELFFGMEKYSSQALAEKFKKIREPGGNTPIYTAFQAAEQDLKGLSGKRNAVILVSDGEENRGDAVKAASALKAAYGDSICFYTILIGASAQGEALLKEIADIGKCGFFSRADDILTTAGMAAFVEKVFLEKKAAPAPAPTPAPQARLDSDGDGVYDEDDKCPNTPKGARVNAQGCWVLGHVLFDFDKAVIKPEAYPLLDEVVAVFKQNPGLKVDLHGHCDNIGTHEYNMDLSLRRAKAVKDHLVSKGIAETSLTTQGFGFTKPVAPNTTKEERSLNRRVELHPIK